MNRLAVTFAATTLVSAIVAVHLWRQLHVERERSSQLQAQLAAEAAARSVAKDTGATIPAPGLNDSEAQSASGGDGAPVSETSADTPARDRRRATAIASGIRDMLRDPESRDMVSAQLEAVLPRMYPDLAQQLGLSPEELARLHELLARQQLDGASNLLDANAAGTRDPAALQGAVEALRRASEAKIATLLGSKYSRWQEYQESLPARQQVTQVRTRLASGGNPLDDTQAAAMIAALSAEQKRMGLQASPLDAQGSIAARLESNRHLREIAARHLTQPQLQSFNRMLEQEERLIRAFGTRQAAQSGAPEPQAP